MSSILIIDDEAALVTSISFALRGEGSFAAARAAMDHLRDAEFGPFKISLVVTRHNVDQLDEFKAIADSYGAQLRARFPDAPQTRQFNEGRYE